MQRSAKKPPMGSTWRTSHWWLFLLAAADVPLITRNYDPLSQEISCTLNNHTPYKSNNHSDMPYSPDRTVDNDPYREYRP